MTKNILLGLGATMALVGTSFAIVQCANEPTSTEPQESTEATITFNKGEFEISKSISDKGDRDKYITEIRKPDNKETLNSIFSSNTEGAISEIKVEGSGKYAIKFTLTPAEGFTLNQSVFDIDYDSGLPEAIITFNQEVFEASKKNPDGTDMSISEYSNHIYNNEKILYSIFSSNIEGAISRINVQTSGNVIMFFLTPAEGFALNGNEVIIYFLINYDTGAEE